MTVHRLVFPAVRRGSFRSECWVFVQCVVVYLFLAAYLLGLFMLVRAVV